MTFHELVDLVLRRHGVGRPAEVFAFTGTWRRLHADWLAADDASGFPDGAA